MHTISLIAPTALLQTAVQNLAWLKIESTTSYQETFQKPINSPVVIILHQRQSLFQLEQLVLQLHQEYPQKTVVVLTDLFSPSLAKSLYASGADHCLAYSVGLSVLSFFLKRLYQKNSSAGSTVIHQKNCKLNLDTGQLQIADRVIQLRPRESQILNVLFRHHQQTVTRNQITAAVWRHEFEPAQATLDVYVRRLRSRLGVYNPCIETIRGFGYRLNLAKLES